MVKYLVSMVDTLNRQCALLLLPVGWSLVNVVRQDAWVTQ